LLAELSVNHPEIILVRERAADYVGELGANAVALVPRGWAGWTYRLGEAVYAGTIPILIGDHTVHPFQDDLPVLRVEESGGQDLLDGVRRVLQATSREELQRMQAELMRARSLFVYDGSRPLRPDSPLDRLLRQLGVRARYLDAVDELRVESVLSGEVWHSHELLRSVPRNLTLWRELASDGAFRAWLERSLPLVREAHSLREAALFHVDGLHGSPVWNVHVLDGVRSRLRHAELEYGQASATVE
jgi:hypothetical protein